MGVLTLVEVVPANASRAHARARRVLRKALVLVVCAKPRTWVALAFVVVAAITAYSLKQGSLLLDGTRYFWLDDDEMISMRYARNLAEGFGLVWNPGERVEGYTNFGFTVMMAAIHALGARDAVAPLIVKLVNLVLASAVLMLTDRLATAVGVRRGVARPVVLLTLALCLDLVYWSSNGFETTAVTAAFLGALVTMLQRSRAQPEAEPVGLFGALALASIPVLRGDGLHVWAGAAFVALAVSRTRARTAWVLGASLIPAAMHLAFRHAYYGDWFPNTYYVKTVGLDRPLVRGLSYSVRFVTCYAVPLFFALAGAVRGRGRRASLLLLAFVPTTLYVLRVGGDSENFPHARFYAHLVPVLLVVAVASVDALRRTSLATRAIAQGAVFVATVAAIGVRSTDTLRAVVSTNGRAAEQVALGVYLREHAYPTSSVAVYMAGIVPYVSRLRAYDLLGKTDAHVARLPYYPGSPIGHGKVDPEYTLGHHPDFVVLGGRGEEVSVIEDVMRLMPARMPMSYDLRIAVSEAFRRDYRDSVVDCTGGASSFFVHRASAEIGHVGAVHPLPR